MVNGNGTETIVDHFLGFPLLICTFDSSGNLISVTLFGFNVMFLFGSFWQRFLLVSFL
jgi:hypothetical protein